MIAIWIFCGEALRFCQALAEYRTTGSVAGDHTVSPWDATPLVFDAPDYVPGNTSAPLTFNVIETSNLLDHVGLLNLLIATAPSFPKPIQRPSSQKLSSVLGATQPRVSTNNSVPIYPLPVYFSVFFPQPTYQTSVRDRTLRKSYSIKCWIRVPNTANVSRGEDLPPTTPPLPLPTLLPSVGSPSNRSALPNFSFESICVCSTVMTRFPGQLPPCPSTSYQWSLTFGKRSWLLWLLPHGWWLSIGRLRWTYSLRSLRRPDRGSTTTKSYVPNSTWQGFTPCIP